MAEPAAEFEARDVPIWLPAFLAALVAGVTWASIIFIRIGFPLGPGDRTISGIHPPPPPGLESAPPKVMSEFAAAQQRRLDALDIDGAMDRLARSGIKDWPCKNCR